MSLFRHGSHDGHGQDRTPDTDPVRHPDPMRDPVRGTALVAAINSWLDWPSIVAAPGFRTLNQPLEGPLTATLVVEADGVPKTVVEHTEMLDRTAEATFADRWPEQGATVPVTVDRADPNRVRIEWGELPSRAELIAQHERERAAKLLAAQQQSAPERHHRLP
jgi:hypothetical protein